MQQRVAVMYTLFVAGGGTNELIGWQDGIWKAKVPVSPSASMCFRKDRLLIMNSMDSRQQRLTLVPYRRTDLSEGAKEPYTLPGDWTLVGAVMGIYPGLAAIDDEFLLLVIAFTKDKTPRFGVARLSRGQVLAVNDLPDYLSLASPQLFARTDGHVDIVCRSVFAAATWTDKGFQPLMMPDVVTGARSLPGNDSAPFYLGHSAEVGPFLVSGPTAAGELGITLLCDRKAPTIRIHAKSNVVTNSMDITRAGDGYVVTVYVEQFTGQGQLWAIHAGRDGLALKTAQLTVAGSLRMIAGAPGYLFFDRSSHVGRALSYTGTRFLEAKIDLSSYGPQKAISLVDIS